MTAQIYNVAVLAAAGFVLGWIFCWFALRSTYLSGQREGRKKVFPSESVRAGLGILILVLVALTGFRYYQVTSCQTSYNEEVAESLFQRAEAQRREGEAQIELLTASLSGDAELARRETLEYISAISDLDRVRASTPIPVAPNCGEFR